MTLFNSPRTPKPGHADVARSVHIYISKGLDRVIIAPTHRNTAGVYYEQDVVDMVEGWPEPEEFGAAFQKAFERFSVKDKDLREYKRSDWPSYKASKLRSISEFEQEFLRINCTGLNSSNAVIRASAQHPTNANIELSVLFNPL